MYLTYTKAILFEINNETKIIPMDYPADKETWQKKRNDVSKKKTEGIEIPTDLEGFSSGRVK
jgi:hypothetical protein